jgi:hypothetical protein
MNHVKNIAIAALTTAAVVAVIFRVKAIRTVVVGA